MASKNEQTILKGDVVDTIGDKYHNDLIAAKQSDTLVEIPIAVQNLGPFSSAAEVVLVYVHPPKDALEQGLPIKSLRWFERVRFTTVGDVAKLHIALKANDFRLARKSDGAMITPRGEWTVEIGHIKEPLRHTVIIQ